MDRHLRLAEQPPRADTVIGTPVDDPDFLDARVDDELAALEARHATPTEHHAVIQIIGRVDDGVRLRVCATAQFEPLTGSRTDDLPRTRPAPGVNATGVIPLLLVCHRVGIDAGRVSRVTPGRLVDEGDVDEPLLFGLVQLRPDDVLEVVEIVSVWGVAGRAVISRRRHPVLSRIDDHDPDVP